MRTYSTQKFADFVGVTRQTVKNWHDTGVVVADVGYKNRRSYNIKHFFIQIVAETMAKKGKTIPVEAVGGEKQPVHAEKPVLSVVESTVHTLYTKEKFTTSRQRKKLSNGLLTKPIPPLEGMNDYAYDVWEFLLPDLVEMGHFRKVDLETFKNYCMNAAMIDRLELETSLEDTVDVFGKLNPKLSYKAKLMNDNKSLGAQLGIGAGNRKGLSTDVKVTSHDSEWDKALA